MQTIIFKTTAIFLLFALFIGNNLVAQNTNNCDGERYIDKIFSNTTKTNVKYGENLNYGVMQELLVSVYEPVGDTIEKRPLVIFVHRGGDRSEFADLCIKYAARGYVAATIDYRKHLPNTELDHVVFLEGLVRGIQDLKAAIRFFRNDSHTANNFKIDSDFIIVGGYDNGAIIALHTAYMDETDFSSPIFDRAGGIEGTSNEYINESSEVQGVINHSGALLNSDFIQAGEPPLISLHGALDHEIPSGIGLLRLRRYDINLSVHGSEVLHDKARRLNIPNQLHLRPEGNHCCIFGGAEYNEYVLSKISFWKEQLCSQTTSVSSNTLAHKNIALFPNPAKDILQIRFEGIHTLQLDLFNSMGKLVGTWQGIQTNTSIPVHQLASGMYFYQLNTDTNTGFQSGKIIIR